MVIDMNPDWNFLVEASNASLGYQSEGTTIGTDGSIKPPFIVCPAGRIAERVIRFLGDACVAVADSNEEKWGTSHCGVKIDSYENILAKFPGATYLVCSALHGNAIETHLHSLGITSVVSYPVLAQIDDSLFANKEYRGMTESILNSESLNKVQSLWRRLADDKSREVLLKKARFYVSRDRQLLRSLKSDQPIYFANDVVELGPTNEAFFDLGAFTGDTLEQWFAVGPKEFSQYVAVEPDSLALAVLSQVRSQDERIVRIGKGISREVGSVAFVEHGLADSMIAVSDWGSSAETRNIEVTTIDQLASEFGCPTQIKMDIEGGERNAIEGGQEVLRNPSVRLSVSSYHFPQDLWEIPQLLLELRPNAEIYLRHYTDEVDDTVCYIIG